MSSLVVEVVCFVGMIRYAFPTAGMQRKAADDISLVNDC